MALALRVEPMNQGTIFAAVAIEDPDATRKGVGLFKICLIDISISPIHKAE